MKTKGYVYILTNKTGSVLYTGVTNNLLRRIYDHKEGSNEGFTKIYNVNRLVYYEEYEKITDAIQREKMIKKKSRQAKEKLVVSQNPYWKDLAENFQ